LDVEEDDEGVGAEDECDAGIWGVCGLW